jgi:hypothetical protein
MKPSEIILIPGKEHQIKEDYTGTEGKIHVVGYAHAPIGEEYSDELKSSFEEAAAGHAEWELIKIVTDGIYPDWQVESWHNFLPLRRAIINGKVDILLAKSIANLAGTHNNARFLNCIIEESGAKLIFVQEDDDMKIIPKHVII